MPRLLFRWTIGPVHDLGFEILAESVRLVGRLYPDAERVVCHNKLNDSQKDLLPAVRLVDQEHCENYLDARRCLYALLPARLDPEAHEMFLDNDVVFTGRPPGVEEFLSRADLLVATEGLYGVYGQYQHLVPPTLKLNSGVFGVPPGFDLRARLLACRLRTDYEDHLDFQGIVARVAAAADLRLVPLDHVQVSPAYRPLQLGRYGNHFVRANRGEDAAWRAFRRSRLRLL